MDDGILILKEGDPRTSEYRLRAYDDFCRVLKRTHKNTFIVAVDRSKDIFNIIDENCGGNEPKAIMMMNGAIKPSDFTKLQSKVFTFQSDAVLPPFNDKHYRNKMAHNIPQFEAVFYNFLHGREHIDNIYPSKRKIHFPAWASEKFDYEEFKTPKEIDFLLSGNLTREYAYRAKFKRLFNSSGLNYYDKLNKYSNSKADNLMFWELLMKSKFSPHDGGVNGRMIARYFESGYAKSVIISPDLGAEMKANGFINGENCVLFDRNTPENNVVELLKNIDIYDWEVLAENAYNLIKTRHSTTVRVEKFLEESLNDELCNNIVSQEGITVKHNAGFFSCCSVRLDRIVAYVNQNNKLPKFVNSSSQFNWYKEKGKSSNDITHDYFVHYDNIKLKSFNTKENINFIQQHQYLNYMQLHYHKVCPLVEKYFSLASPIFSEFKSLEKKYALDYENTCVLLHRGNDKITETKLCEYSEIIERANKVLSINPQVKFLIQSDETEFLEVMSETFPDNSFYFDGKIRHMTKHNNTVDRVIGKNHIFSKYYLAITFLMSKCKYLVCGSGNCDLWVLLYRGHANNLYQFLDGVWIEPAHMKRKDLQEDVKTNESMSGNPPSYVELTPNHPDKDR